MFHFSDFVAHFAANRRYMAPVTAATIRKVALTRLAERQAAGRGDTPLLFGDLIDRIEAAVSGAANVHIQGKA